MADYAKPSDGRDAERRRRAAEFQAILDREATQPVAAKAA